MKQNQDYKNLALDALRGNWAQPLLCTVVLMLLIYVGVAPSFIGNLTFLGQISLDFVNPFYLSGFGFLIYIFTSVPLMDC